MLLEISVPFFEVIPIEMVKYFAILLDLCSISNFSISFFKFCANSITLMLSKIVIIPNSSPQKKERKKNRNKV